VNFASLCGYLAVSLGVVGTLAQVARVRRDGAAGVSPATWTLFCLMGGFWIPYGVAAHSPEVVLGSAILLPMQLFVVSRLRPIDPVTLGRAAAFFALCCVAPALVLGWDAGVLGVGVAMTVTRMPQLIELVREPDASGVSATSWFLGVAGCALWVTYYASTGMAAALIATAAAGLTSLAIAVLATWRHAGSRPPLVVLEAVAP
jgi:uncharacterized protein with PQ loop repeat